MMIIEPESQSNPGRPRPACHVRVCAHTHRVGCHVTVTRDVKFDRRLAACCLVLQDTSQCSPVLREARCCCLVLQDISQCSPEHAACCLVRGSIGSPCSLRRKARYSGTTDRHSVWGKRKAPRRHFLAGDGDTAKAMQPSHNTSVRCNLPQAQRAYRVEDHIGNESLFEQ